MRLNWIVFAWVGLTACNSQNGSFTGPNPMILNNGNSGGNAITQNTPAPTATPGPIASPTATPTATPVVSFPPVSGIGLVWNGSGACDDDCALAGATAVTDAGLTPVYVNGNTPAKTPAEIAAIFANAKVWVMPGGYASEEVDGMSTALKAALKSFISGGGGYVGWCAGAFAADTSIGTINEPGLGIFPGGTEVYATTSPQNQYGGSIEKLTWFNEIHYFYLEGGPNFTNLPPTVEIVARYDDQVSVAAARTTYGNGRVFLSGVHPEAPTWWWFNTGITDPDGSDIAYAADMIKWAAGFE